MAKNVQLKIDVESNSVEVASDSVLTLTQQLKELKKGLQTLPEGSKEFNLVNEKFNETKDALDRVNVKSGELFGTLQLLPGPLGAIASQTDNAINSLKIFTSIKASELRSGFKGLVDDFKQIGKGLLDITGLTKAADFAKKAYAATVSGLTKVFTAFKVSEDAAAASARGFATALAATGIGALVVAIGLLIANWDKLKDAISGATFESKAFEAAQTEVTKELTDFNKKLFDVKNSIDLAKSGLKNKDEALKEYNDTLGDSVGYAKNLDEAEGLLEKNTDKVVESIKLRALAQVFYAKSAEASAKAITGEGLEPDTYDQIINFFKGFGSFQGQLNQNALTFVENLQKVKKEAEAYEDLGDEYIEKYKALKKEIGAPVKPPDTKETKSALDQVLKDIEAAKRSLKSAEEAEILSVKATYKEQIERAKKLGVDTSILKLAQQKALKAIDDKYRKQEIADDLKFKTDLANAQKEADKQNLDRIKLLYGEFSKESIKEQKRQLAAQATEIQNGIDYIEAKKVKTNEEIVLLEQLKAKRIEIANQGIALEQKIEQKSLEDRVALNKSISESLQEGTKAYYQNRLEGLELQKEQELASLKGTNDTEEARYAIEQKYAKLRKELKKQEIAATGQAVSASIDAIAGVAKAISSSYDEEAKTSRAAFEKRKKLQKATALLSAASGLIQILTQPSTLPSPFDFIVKAANAVALGISTGVQLKQIDKVQFEGASGGTGGSTPTVQLPTFNQGQPISAPNIGGASVSQTGQLAGIVTGAVNQNNSQDRPIRAYVVGSEVTTNQQLDRRISAAARLS